MVREVNINLVPRYEKPASGKSKCSFFFLRHYNASQICRKEKKCLSMEDLIKSEKRPYLWGSAPIASNGEGEDKPPCTEQSQQLMFFIAVLISRMSSNISLEHFQFRLQQVDICPALGCNSFMYAQTGNRYMNRLPWMSLLSLICHLFACLKLMTENRSRTSVARLHIISADKEWTIKSIRSGRTKKRTPIAIGIGIEACSHLI